MPKISELPDSAGLTGDEWIAVVQDGITKKTQIQNFLLSAKRSLSNPRWIQENGELINKYVISTESQYWPNGQLTIHGKVDVNKLDSDLMVWQWTIQDNPVFVSMEPYLLYDRGEYVDGGQVDLGAGRYVIRLIDDGPEHNGTATYSTNGVPAIITFNNQGDTDEFTIPFGEVSVISVSATNGALVQIFQSGDFAIGFDEMPTISWFGDQIQVRCHAPPRNVLVTAKAVLLDSSYTVLLESGEITLSIRHVEAEEEQLPS